MIAFFVYSHYKKKTAKENQDTSHGMLQSTLEFIDDYYSYDRNENTEIGLFQNSFYYIDFNLNVNLLNNLKNKIEIESSIELDKFLKTS